ncbi:ChaN family lipoprotein [Salinivirga cyanobacteriivorans]
MKTFFSVLLLLIGINLIGQNPKSYELYNSKGKKVSWEKMTKDLQKQDVVFFGELHNSAIAHWLQLELTKNLYMKVTNKLALAAEMFEADNQIIIDEYLNDLIANKNFEEEARLWDNYKTDYKPLLEFAKQHSIPFIASNIPRRYAALVNKKGFKGLEELSDEAKKWLPPLPVPFDIELPGYAKMLKMAAHMPGKKGNAENLAKAQAIKDATMAHFIVQNMQPGMLMLHFNGRYHSDNHEGIVWYVKEYAPETKIKTISTVLQNDVNEIPDKNTNVADYILVVNEDVTETY